MAATKYVYSRFGTIPGSLQFIVESISKFMALAIRRLSAD